MEQPCEREGLKASGSNHLGDRCRFESRFPGSARAKMPRNVTTRQDAPLDKIGPRTSLVVPG
jgi:hypothetical protein